MQSLTSSVPLQLAEADSAQQPDGYTEPQLRPRAARLPSALQQALLSAPSSSDSWFACHTSGDTSNMSTIMARWTV